MAAHPREQEATCEAVPDFFSSRICKVPLTEGLEMAPFMK